MNRAAANTRAELKRRGLSQNQGALLVESDSGNFSKMLQGDGRGPGRALAARMKARLGIETEWWDEEISDEEAAAILEAATAPDAPTPTAHDSGEHPQAVEPPKNGTEDA